MNSLLEEINNELSKLKCPLLNCYSNRMHIKKTELFNLFPLIVWKYFTKLFMSYNPIILNGTGIFISEVCSNWN